MFLLSFISSVRLFHNLTPAIEIDIVLKVVLMKFTVESTVKRLNLPKTHFPKQSLFRQNFPGVLSGQKDSHLKFTTSVNDFT